jgi:hypothetical protein
MLSIYAGRQETSSPSSTYERPGNQAQARNPYSAKLIVEPPEANACSPANEGSGSVVQDANAITVALSIESDEDTKKWHIFLRCSLGTTRKRGDFTDHPPFVVEHNRDPIPTPGSEP